LTQPAQTRRFGNHENELASLTFLPESWHFESFCRTLRQSTRFVLGNTEPAQKSSLLKLKNKPTKSSLVGLSWQKGTSLAKTILHLP